MKIFQKRLCAVLIDTHLFACVLVELIKIMPAWYFNVLGAFGYLIFFVPFFAGIFCLETQALVKNLWALLYTTTVGKSPPYRCCLSVPF